MSEQNIVMLGSSLATEMLVNAPSPSNRKTGKKYFPIPRYAWVGQFPVAGRLVKMPSVHPVWKEEHSMMQFTLY